MNKFIGFFILLFLFFQFSFFSFLGIKIDLLLILVMILAQRRFDFSGIFWIFVCGILADIFSANFFGINLLSFIAIALLTNLANGFFVAFESNKIINSVVYFTGKIFFDLIKFQIGSVLALFGILGISMVPDFKIFSFSYLVELVVFIFFSFVLLWGYEKLEKISGEKRQILTINKK